MPQPALEGSGLRPLSGAADEILDLLLVVLERPRSEDLQRSLFAGCRAAASSPSIRSTLSRRAAASPGATTIADHRARRHRRAPLMLVAMTASSSSRIHYPDVSPRCGAASRAVRVDGASFRSRWCLSRELSTKTLARPRASCRSTSRASSSGQTTTSGHSVSYRVKERLVATCGSVRGEDTSRALLFVPDRRRHDMWLARRPDPGGRPRP